MKEISEAKCLSLVYFKEFLLPSPVAAIKQHLKLEEDDENRSEYEEDEHDYVASKVLKTYYCVKLFEANNSLFYLFRNLKVTF